MSEPGHLVPAVWLEAHGLTRDDLERVAAALAKQGKPRLLDPLPRPVRLRLAVQRRIDGAACWLVEHCHPRAGEALWRLFGQW